MQDLDGSLGTGQKLRSSVSFEIMFFKRRLNNCIVHLLISTCVCLRCY